MTRVDAEPETQDDAHVEGVPSSTSRRRWARGLAAPFRGLARSPRRQLLVLGAIAVVLAVALGAMVWSIRESDRSAEAGAEAQRVAAERVVALLSYDYRSIRQELPPILDSLSGPFRDEYGRLVNEAVIPAAELQQVTTRASLAGSSVVTAAPERVELLMFLNQTSASPASPQPALDGSRVRVVLERVDDQWKITALTPV